MSCITRDSAWSHVAVTGQFSMPPRRQSRRADVRLYQRKLSPAEWTGLRGLPVTDSSRGSTSSMMAGLSKQPSLFLLVASVCGRQCDVPDRAMWERGYRAEADRSLLLVAHTLDEALTAVSRFADPLLDGSACGMWQPISRRWATNVSGT
jgi:hypothetical protein